MTRRPAGPKVTAGDSAIGDHALSAPERSPRDAARLPAAPGPAAPLPAASRPVALRLAAAAQALEAAGLAVAAVFSAVSTADGRSYQLASGIMLTLIAIGTAAGIAGITTALAMARAWTRIPTAMIQLFVIIGGITLLQGHRPEWGVPALVLAGTCLAGLATPASLRALNRPSVRGQTAPGGQEGR